MNDAIDFTRPPFATRSAVLGRQVVATSQPLAAQAGLRMMMKGGNAVDAALAAAMMLTVVEPTGCGLGSDAFALVWDGARLHGLNASGRAPTGWTPQRFAGRQTMPDMGWDAVTVPGAVSAWVALAQRFARLPLGELAGPAISAARDGFPVSPVIARQWARGAARLGGAPGFAECFLPDGRAPRAGECFRSAAHARSLAEIAASGGESFYRGELAARLVAHAREHGGAMTAQDLADHRADWVEPLAQPFAGHVVHEIPPNGQGIAAQMALGMLERLGIGELDPDSADSLHLQIEAMKLAFVDLDAHHGDPDAMQIDPQALLSPQYLEQRAAQIDRRQAREPGPGEPPRRGGTVYLACADAGGMMVSFIQSNYMGFGSGIVVPGTGISLQNRGAGFVLHPGHANEVGPRKRPSHTIIPAFATDALGRAALAFGVMGGPMQCQGHVQMTVRVLARGQDVQAAADAPRWRVLGGRRVAVEPGIAAAVRAELAARGHRIEVEEAADAAWAFGGAQLVQRLPGSDAAPCWAGGSDPRKDGQAVAC